MIHSHSGHLGDFEIIRELGRGGMGVVYLANDDRARHNPTLFFSILRHGL